MIRAGIYTKVYDRFTKVQARHPNKRWPGPWPPLIIPGTYCTAANRAPGLPGDSFTGHAKEYPMDPDPDPDPDRRRSASPFLALLIRPGPGGGS